MKTDDKNKAGQLKRWSGRQDSNLRPSAPKAVGMMVGAYLKWLFYAIFEALHKSDIAL